MSLPSPAFLVLCPEVGMLVHKEITSKEVGLDGELFPSLPPTRASPDRLARAALPSAQCVCLATGVNVPLE